MCNSTSFDVISQINCFPHFQAYPNAIIYSASWTHYMSSPSFIFTSPHFPCFCRRLDRLEGQTSRIFEQLQDFAEARAMEEGTHAQRFDAIFTSLRDVQRGVQVVRDKQVVPPSGSFLHFHVELTLHCDAMR